MNELKKFQSNYFILLVEIKNINSYFRYFRYFNRIYFKLYFIIIKTCCTYKVNIIIQLII